MFLDNLKSVYHKKYTSESCLSKNYINPCKLLTALRL